MRRDWELSCSECFRGNSFFRWFSSAVSKDDLKVKFKVTGLKAELLARLQCSAHIFYSSVSRDVSNKSNQSFKFDKSDSLQQRPTMTEESASWATDSWFQVWSATVWRSDSVLNIHKSFGALLTRVAKFWEFWKLETFNGNFLGEFVLTAFPW